MFAAWLFGVGFGAAMIAVVAASIATANPPLIAVASIEAALLIFAAYGFAYTIAVMALAAPIAATVVNFGTPNPLGINVTERRARAFSVGLTAVLNAVGAPAIASVAFPVIGPFAAPLLVPWAFIVTSLAAIPPVSRNRIYQGILGWSGWIFPMSLIASFFGFIWFAINFVPALVSGLMGGGWPFRIDWSTGAIETVGGVTSFISTATAAAGTVGHFVFILAPLGANPTAFQQPFVVAGPPVLTNFAAHETGHTLDYTAFGGFRVLFALIDQIILGNSFTAYSELTADSHVPNRGRIQVRVWS
jgi:hypothetical protein